MNLKNITILCIIILMETLTEIYFYSHNGEYGYMSNFYPCVFTHDNIKFNCSEQFLMYVKAKTFEPDNIELHMQILTETNPSKIKNFGHNVANYNDVTWASMRYNVMVQGLKCKFEQNPELKAQLKSTGKKLLYEASPSDKIWGIGLDIAQVAKQTHKINYGTNLLGRALMEVRNGL